MHSMRSINPDKISGTYLETVAKGAKTNLLQPCLHLAGFPVRYTRQDAFGNVLPHHTQRSLGKAGRCSITGVHDDSF